MKKKGNRRMLCTKKEGRKSVRTGSTHAQQQKSVVRESPRFNERMGKNEKVPVPRSARSKSWPTRPAFECPYSGLAPLLSSFADDLADGKYDDRNSHAAAIHSSSAARAG